MNKVNFKVGDILTIIRSGNNYSSYIDFFYDNEMTQYASRYGRNILINQKYRLLFIGRHRSSDKPIGIFESVKTHKTYIYGLDILSYFKLNPMLVELE